MVFSMHYPGSTTSPVTLTNDPPRGSFGPSPRRPLGGIPGGPCGAPRIGARGSTIGTVRKEQLYDLKKSPCLITLTRLKKRTVYRFKTMKETIVKEHNTNISKLRNVLLCNHRNE